jgi:hypothetical protein
MVPAESGDTEMKTYTFNASGGISNLKDQIFRSSEDVISTLKEAVNVKIDGDGFWTLREGFGAKKYTGVTHSLDPKGSGLFVDASVLRRITSTATTPYTTVAISTMSNNDPMVYAKLPGRGIACSNGIDIGIVKDDAYTAFSSTSEQYQRKMPAGQILTWFNGTLFVARGGEIYYSDPMNYGVMDTRNKKKRLKGYVTLMVAVDDGLFISDSYDTLFYQGATPHTMTAKHVADYPAIYGMNTTVERRLVGDGSLQGNVAYWMSSKGVCMGTSGGVFVNLAIEKYELSDVPLKGAAFFRNNNGIPQFISAGII